MQRSEARVRPVSTWHPLIVNPTRLASHVGLRAPAQIDLRPQPNAQKTGRHIILRVFVDGGSSVQIRVSAPLFPARTERLFDVWRALRAGVTPNLTPELDSGLSTATRTRTARYVWKRRSWGPRRPGQPTPRKWARTASTRRCRQPIVLDRQSHRTGNRGDQSEEVEPALKARLDLDVLGAGPMSGDSRSGGGTCRCTLVLRAAGGDDCRPLEAVEGEIQAEEELPDDLRDGHDGLDR
jgi:hypothetical protein